MESQKIDLSAFGKNDIRGIYGKNVTEFLFENTGKGFVEFLKEYSKKTENKMWITVATDVRNHSESLKNALIKGIISTGANAIDLGIAPTPLGYFSEANGIPTDVTNGEPVIASLIVTASHNPPEYNGLKMTYNKISLNEVKIQEVKKLTQQIIETPKKQTNKGIVKKYDIIKQYSDFMLNKFQGIGKGIKIVVDSANATGGIVAPNLYKQLGCEVVELYSEPDGNFPNHHPNPSLEETLTDIKATVIKEKADFGIAFDGDADRIGLIDSQGRSLTGDKLLLIFALDIIEQMKNRTEKPVVISEVKCSQVLYDTINNSGGNAIMCKTGHGYIKEKMKETNAVLGGEMSGHTFFKDRYFGFDDAVYAGCRVIEIVAKHKNLNKDFKIDSLLSAFDKIYSSKEIRYKCENEKKKPVLKLLEEKIRNTPNAFGGEISDIITIDGLRIILDGGFALIRQSNTEPVFTLRFEAKNQEICENYQNKLLKLLDECMMIV